MSDKNERIIEHSLVYQYVKAQVKNEEIIEEVYEKTLSLLEDKYGILFDVDKVVNL